MNEILAYVGTIFPFVLSAMVVAARALGAVLLFPAYAVVDFPARVKLFLAICLAVVLYGTVPESSRQLEPDRFMIAFLAEFSTGVMIGFTIRMLVFALQISGVIAAQSTSLAQMFGGAAEGGAMPVIGRVIAFAALAFAFSMGLHVRIIVFYVESYEWVPLGAFPDYASFTAFGLTGLADMFYLGVALAAPFMIGSTLYNITLGAINRAMPQLMVAFVGAPALVAGGMIFLLLLAPLIAGLWYQHVSDFLAGTGHFR